MQTNPKETFSPGPVFISYSRKDLEEVKQIVKALKTAGISIWQDIESMDVGMTESQIRKAILEECSGLLFYVTENSMDSVFIKEIELCEAYKKFREDETFSIIPFSDIPWDKADRDFNGVFMGKISRFNGVNTLQYKSITEALNTLRKRILSSIVNRINESCIKISVMTHITTPKNFRSILDLDWSYFSKKDIISKNYWIDSAREVFLDVRNVLMKQGITNLEMYSKAHLHVGFAFGFIFRRETGFSLKIHQFDQIWSTQIEKNPTSHLRFSLTECNIGSKHLAISISISNNVENALKKFINDNNIFRCCLDCMPSSGDLPYTIPNTTVAAEMAGEIRKEIIDASNKYNITDIHLFAAIPIALAYMIGWRLNACGKIHLYHHDKNSIYKPSWIIDAND